MFKLPRRLKKHTLVTSWKGHIPFCLAVIRTFLSNTWFNTSIRCYKYRHQFIIKWFQLRVLNWPKFLWAVFSKYVFLCILFSGFEPCLEDFYQNTWRRQVSFRVLLRGDPKPRRMSLLHLGGETSIAPLHLHFYSCSAMQRRRIKLYFFSISARLNLFFFDRPLIYVMALRVAWNPLRDNG